MMDELALLLIVGGVLLVASPILALVGFLRGGRANARITELESQVLRLTLETQALATRLRAAPAEATDTAAIALQPAPDAPLGVAGETPAAGTAATSPAAPQAMTEPPPLPPQFAAASTAGDAEDVPTRREDALEQDIGTRWVVWVGGIALALGGIFLVKFSIEMGVFGPIGRILMGALFAAALIAAGEWFRRNEPGETGLAVPSAHIPGILTAAGTISAFATVFAAHALYGLIPAGLTFILLAAVALATMVAALLHGPWLAALGLIGAHVVPFLVASEQPSLIGFVVYELIVCAAALGLAHLRAWRWISDAALALAIGVAFFVQLEYGGPQAVANNGGLALHVAGLLALVTAFRAQLEHVALPYVDRPADWRVIGLTAAVAVLALARLAVAPADPLNGVLVVLAVGAGFGMAARWSALAPTAGVTALVAGIGVLGWRPTLAWEAQFDTLALMPPPNLSLRPAAVNEFLVTATSSGLAVLAAGLLPSLRTAARAPRATAWLIGGGGLGAGLILLATWARIDQFATNRLFAAAALALAALLALVTEWLFRVEMMAPAGASRADAVSDDGEPEHGAADAGTPDAGIGLASGAGAVLCVAALGLAFGIGLEGEALTVAMALMLPAIAWLHGLRPWPGLRRVALVVGAAMAARIGYVVLSEGFGVGPTPVVNALLLVFGLPAAAAWWSARRFAATGRDLTVEALEALALVFLGLLFVFEIRHLSTGGDIWRRTSDLAEIGLQVSGGFLMALITSLAGRQGGAALRHGGALLRLVTLVAAGPVLLVLASPLVTHDAIAGTWPFDTLALGYGVPALMAGLAAWWTSRDAPAATAGGGDILARLATPQVLGGFALALALAYALYSVRLWAVGPLLHRGGVLDAELWAYSAVLIGFGIATLGFGLLARSRSARRAAFALIAIAVLKVFLIDLGSLSGLPRALSFIALGATLIGIGLLYQRLARIADRPPET